MNLQELKEKLENLAWLRQEKGYKALFDFLLTRLKEKLKRKKSYQRWLQKHQMTEADIALACQEIKNWQFQPKFSIVLPVYNIDKQWLEKAIDSVRNQIYTNWELCIADDASTKPHIYKLLENYQERDRRIKFVLRTETGNISAATNSALELATGDYICLLDHDDELAINALFEVAKLIDKHPEADFIYSDEDHIDTRGNHFDPILKPDWSPDYFHTQMYTCHLGVYRTALVREIGGFRSPYDGAQDYDLVLRIVEKTKNIYHIPKILYHWRSLPSSSAGGKAGKPWAFQVGKKALESMLERSPYPGYVAETKMPGVFRVRRHLKNQPLVSIVIPSAGKVIETEKAAVCLLKKCLDSIQQKSTYDNFEIMVVDGYDIPEQILSRLGNTVQLVRDSQAFNYSRRVNLGAARGRGEILLLLNDDTEVLTPDWLESMLEFAQQKEIGAVGAKLLFPDGKIQHTGVVIIKDSLGNPSPMHVFYGYDGYHPGSGFSNFVNRNYLAVTGACLMMRKAVFEKLGGLPEEFPLNYNDVDLCLKAYQAGYRNVVTPYAQLIHYGSASRPDRKVKLEEKKLFAQTWGDYITKLGYDPYYNPNFRVDPPNFELKI